MFRRVLFLLLALAGAAGAESLDLSGPWRFQTDPAAADSAATLAAPGLDEAGWKAVPVPGKWADYGFPNYHGKAWYRREVSIPAEWKGAPLFLQLPPADQSDRVFLNGQPIGGVVNKPQLARFYPVPPEHVRWGAKNLLAVEVTNNFGRGGFAPGAARLQRPGPFQAEPVKEGSTEPLPLGATQNLRTKMTWVTGWHDPGTSPTRPVLAAAEGPAPGSEALAMKIEFPNASGEYVDFALPSAVAGAAWVARGADFLRFSCQTDDLSGEMQLALNAGNFRFGTGGGGYSTSFRVAPGGWTTVTLPLAEFAKRTPQTISFMPNAGGVAALSLGYKNNELAGAGTIRFANFEVGRFPGGVKKTVPMDGLWFFAPDAEDQGLKAGWAQPQYEAKAWATLVPGRPWQAQGFKDLAGPGWFRQEVEIPAEWAGLRLRLRLGQLLNPLDDAEVFFNGQSIGRTSKYAKEPDDPIPAELVKAGARNLVAVRVNGAGGGGQNGLAGQPFLLEPLPVSVELLRTEEPGAKPAPPASFDPGPLPGAKLTVVLRVPRVCLPEQPLLARCELTDCFFRPITQQDLPLAPVTGQPYWETRIALEAESSRRIYFSESFDLRVQVHDRGGTVWQAATQRGVTLAYGSRDCHALPALAESWAETPYGKLKLVDVIETGADPATEGHPYKEGGVRGSWVGRIAYSTWEQGIRVREWKGQRYREANNNEWFGYRLGRGTIKPGTGYLVRIEYPEDKTRYCPINVDAGRNYMGLGFKTGVAPGNPFDDYPLSGGYSTYDLLVMPDAVTYGSTGSRSVPSEHGFWIFFHDTGRAYAPAYEAGPAVREIRVYEIPDVAKAAAPVHGPAGEPQRLLVADWEREPEWVARDLVQHARFFGYNAISPSMLKWGSLAFWRTEALPFKVTKPVRETLPDGEPSAYDQFLDATREAGLKLFPRLEYGGSNNIPKDERAIAETGKPAMPNRFSTWCADLLRPGVKEEMSTLWRETIGNRIAANPQLGGVLFRIRSDRLPISYSRFDIEMYARETKTALPANLAASNPANDTALAKWAGTGANGKAYQEWWQAKRRDFHQDLVTELKKYRPDLKLLYYNWDSDNWNLGKYVRTPQDFTDAFNVHTARQEYEREAAFQSRLAPERYVQMLTTGPATDHLLRPELYAGVKDFALLGPINWKYLASNPGYINFFRTGEQLALTKIFNYEEKGRWNVQGDNYESSELSTGGPAFSMAEQVQAVFHGDPWILTETTYTYGQGFAETHRRFARAFLSLPARLGEVVPDAVAPPNPNIRVRLYRTQAATYLSVTHIGYQSGDAALTLPGPWPKAPTVTDLMSNETVPSEMRAGKLALKLSLPPMSLQTYRIE